MSGVQFDDLCDWWTRERIEEEEKVWQRDQFFVEYANEVRKFAKQMGLKKGASILELGCGTGHVGPLLAKDFSYNGTDGSELMIRVAKEKHPDIADRFFVKNLRTSVEVDCVGIYDMVCSFAVLKHFSTESWPFILMNMLANADHGLIQVQVRDVGYPTVEDGTEVHHTWVNRQELLGFAEKAGHEVVELADTGKDVSPYMDHAMEAYLKTRRLK